MRLEFIALAKQTIDSHAAVIAQVLRQLDSVTNKQEIQRRFMEVAEPMALTEENLYNLMMPDEREEVHRYSDGILMAMSGGEKDSDDLYMPLMKTLGIDKGCCKSTNTTDLPPV